MHAITIQNIKDSSGNSKLNKKMNRSTNKREKGFKEQFNIYKLEGNKASLLFEGNTQEEAFQFVKLQPEFSWEGVKESTLQSATIESLSKNYKGEWGRMKGPYLIDETEVSYWMKASDVKESLLNSIRLELHSGRRNSPSGCRFIKMNEFRNAGAEIEFFSRNPILWMQVNDIKIEYKTQEDILLDSKIKKVSKPISCEEEYLEEIYEGTDSGSSNSWKSLLNRIRIEE